MAWKKNVYANTLKVLYEEQPAADIKFKLSDGELTGHKWLLSARLPFFKNMFEAGMTESKTGEIMVYDWNRSTYDSFLRHLYYGEELPRLEEIGCNEAMLVSV